MIGIQDMIKEIVGIGFINLTEPHNMELEGLKHHRAAASYSEVQEARRLHTRGLSKKEIAIRLGRSGSTIHSWLYHQVRKNA